MNGILEKFGDWVYKRHKHKRYKRIPVEQIIRNFNISLLNSDIKLDKIYRKIYKDLKCLFKNTYVEENDKYIIVKSKEKRKCMNIILFSDDNLYYYQGAVISYNGHNKYSKMWDRFEHKYTMLHKDKEKIAEWYIKNVILYIYE